MKREAFISFSFLRECILSPPFTFFIFLIFFFHIDNTLNQIFVPSFDKQTLLFFWKLPTTTSTWITTSKPLKLQLISHISPTIIELPLHLHSPSFSSSTTTNYLHSPFSLYDYTNTKTEVMHHITNHRLPYNNKTETHVTSLTTHWKPATTTSIVP